MLESWRVSAAQQASVQSGIICIMTSGQISNRQRVKQLLEKPGNGNCADCGAAGRESLTDAGPIFTEPLLLQYVCLYFHHTN